MEEVEFKLLGFPTKILPSALWLAGIYVLFGVSGGVTVDALLGIASFVVILFASILIHELGHAVTAQRFGMRDIAIRLHGFGGDVTYRGSPTAGQSLLISLAGPGIEIVLGGAVLIARIAIGPLDGFAETVVFQLIYINLFWGLFNLLPVMPLDGGNALRSILMLTVPDRAWPIAAGVGMVTAVAVALLAWWVNFIFIVLFMGLFAHRNWQIIQLWRREQAEAAEAPA